MKLFSVFASTAKWMRSIHTPQIKPNLIKREENFSKWYQDVIKQSGLAEPSAVRGCMVIKPNGYAIWEKIQEHMNKLLVGLDYQNAYFPLFIPLKFFKKEADHIEGFAKECAVVTHYRLKKTDTNDLIPDPEAKLEEPLVVRPTSETIIGDSFRKWVHSYRDLPIKINQWANVVRWELSTNMFLRTTEFLWHEAHTAHASKKEALEENKKIIAIYRDFIQNVLGIPVIVGEKSPGERFAGADNTFTFEAMMQDRKALQIGTTHYLGQHFSKSFEIIFKGVFQENNYAYTTSSGLTTRLIGGLIMVHGDDYGLRIPPRIAQKQIVIIPSGINNDEGLDENPDLKSYIEGLTKTLKGTLYHGAPLGVQVDNRSMNGGRKAWNWIQQGVPLRLEIGNRERLSNTVTLYRRDEPHKTKISIPMDKVSECVVSTLDQIQTNYFKQAESFRNLHMKKDIATFEELRQFFTPKNEKNPEIHGGFVLAKWCGDPETEAKLKEIKATIRCLPLEQSGTSGKCIITGLDATLDVIIGKSY